MRTVARLLVVAVASVLTTSAANAVVFGGSNFSFPADYPDPHCTKPLPKPMPPFGQTKEEIDDYNAEVDEYNLQLDEYLSCIKEYLSNADNDRQRILEKENAVIAAAKSL
jgi:hypothetical protein